MNQNADERCPTHRYTSLLWTIHNGVFDAPTVFKILIWPHFTVKVLTIYAYKDNTEAFNNMTAQLYKYCN